MQLLATLHGESTNRVRGAVDEWPVSPILVGLFGSAARRDGDADSDIDVLVVSDDPDLEDRVDQLADQIRRWTGNRAQVIGRTPTEIARLSARQGADRRRVDAGSRGHRRREDRAREGGVTARSKTRTQSCDRSHALTRLARAGSFLLVAELPRVRGRK